MQKLLCLSCVLMSGTALALDVPTGDSLSDYNVRNGDPLTVEGSVTNTTVGTYGQMTVRNGGLADTTTVGRRGTLTITGSGSSASDTILNSFSQMKSLPERSSRGVRQKKLTGAAIEADREFWNQDFFTFCLAADPDVDTGFVRFRINGYVGGILPACAAAVFPDVVCAPERE